MLCFHTLIHYCISPTSMPHDSVCACEQLVGARTPDL